jgi:hypothetical protein
MWAFRVRDLGFTVIYRRRWWLRVFVVFHCANDYDGNDGFFGGRGGLFGGVFSGLFTLDDDRVGFSVLCLCQSVFVLFLIVCCDGGWVEG